MSDGKMGWPELKAAFRELVLGLEFSTHEYATRAYATPLLAVTAEMVYPDWLRPENRNLNDRLLEIDKPVARRVAEGIVYPDRDQLQPAVDRQTLHWEAVKLLKALGELASVLALHGAQDRRSAPDGASWRRVCPFTPWPQPVLDELEKARAACNTFAPIWLAFRLGVE